MFTGIIEELGKVSSIRKGNETIVITIGAQKVLEDVHLGDSIAVNGVCLTVTSYTDRQFTVDVMPETYKTTTLKELNTTSTVNLERAMAANGRFGGHFVSGHVDGTGEIIDKRPEKNAIYYQIKMPEPLMAYFMMKGSVSIDGTSLTIFGVTDDTITVSLIPHTVSHTVLGEKGKGQSVNVECDMLAKYVNRMMVSKVKERTGGKRELTFEFFEQNGF